MQPYSGSTLRVFNHDVDTKELNILIDDSNDLNQKNHSVVNNFKPWWELGNWNFNHLRDNYRLDENQTTYPSRLYGNYFVLSFRFIGSGQKRVEFESLTCSLTKDKK